MTEEFKEMIAPRWCEEHNGIFVPIIGKIIEAKNLVAPEPMNWYDFMNLAKTQGKQVATRKELIMLYRQKDEINAILKEHDGDLLEGRFGASSEYNKLCGWFIDFSYGFCIIIYKTDSFLARTVKELPNYKPSTKNAIGL